MPVPFYLVKNPLRGSSRFIARTMTTGNIDRDELVKRMVMANTSLTGPDIMGMLSLLEEILLYELSQGKSIDLGNILSLRPSVRGSFKSTDLRKDPTALEMGVNLRVLKSFEKKFQNKAKAEKQEQQLRHPYVQDLNMEVLETRGRGKSIETSIYALHRYRPVQLLGSFLKEQAYDWKALELGQLSKPDRKMLVTREDLEVLHHSGGKIIFSLAPSFQSPSWLKAGVDIALYLVYEHRKSHCKVNSNGLAMRWQEG
ncbi:MAG: hypothetical protein JXR70_06515 [Spirochaetales bacterium]|nr:hypothetical protein [Spirochaetales bacterium]